MQLIQLNLCVYAPTVQILAGFYVNIFQIDFVCFLQPNFAIDAAVGQVVDHISKRRNIRALPRIHDHGKHIVPAGDKPCQLAGKRCVPAQMFGQKRSVQKHLCRRHHTFKMQKQAFPRAGSNANMPAIAADALTIPLVEIIERQLVVRVR